MFTLNELMAAFDNNHLYAWEILYSEILMQSTAINTEHLKKLVILYSKGVEKLTSLQNNHDNYFKSKISQLMGQRKVIQCLNNQRNSDQKLVKTVKQQDSRKKMHMDNALQARKKEMEMRVAYGIQQTKTGKISKMIKEQAIKEEKIKCIVMKSINNQQQRLKSKILNRRHRASLSSRMTASLKLQMSAVSTYGEGLDYGQNLDSILDDISFIDSIDEM